MTSNLTVCFAGHLGRFRLDASFSTPAAGVTGLFGPSGCGKTTVLRAIGGLTHFQSGHCVLGDEVWQEDRQFTPPHRRAIGYVFQEPSLFPHLTVTGNLRFAAQKGDGNFFDEIVDLLGLKPLLDRAPHALSGGERQRVAVGRALLSRPRLLLMDEPLSALDVSAKEDILPLLEKLLRTLSIPTLYVSHDIREIERLADHLVLMQAGNVIASGRLEKVQADPALPLAAARDASVTLKAHVISGDVGDGLMALDVEGIHFIVPRSGAAQGEVLRLRIAAGDVSIALEQAEKSSILNAVLATVISMTPLGEAEMLAVLSLHGRGQPCILARLTRRSAVRLGLEPGKTVFAQFKSIALAR